LDKYFGKTAVGLDNFMTSEGRKACKRVGKITNLLNVMLISNFELLISRLVPGGATPLNRKVVQGYFLSITNLSEDQPLPLNLTVVASKFTGSDIDRDFIPQLNTVAIFDSPTNDNKILSMVATNPVNPFISSFRTDQMPVIEPLQTALVTILPNIGLAFSNPNTKLEIRGHVRLYQTPNADGSARPPAQVMLSAECRGTFLDNNFGTTMAVSSYDFDQIAYAMPLASGQAQNTVETLFL
jgi:hypothetical protein